RGDTRAAVALDRGARDPRAGIPGHQAARELRRLPEVRRPGHDLLVAPPPNAVPQLAFVVTEQVIEPVEVGAERAAQVAAVRDLAGGLRHGARLLAHVPERMPSARAAPCARWGGASPHGAPGRVVGRLTARPVGWWVAPRRARSE